MPTSLRSLRPIHLVLALLLTGCGDDTPSGPDPDPSDGTVTAVIDGVSWTATSVGAGYGSRILSINASVDGGAEMSLTLQESGPGVYTIGVGFTSVLLREGGTTWTATSGQIDLALFTGALATGTFSFTAERTSGSGVDTRTVVSGTFDVRLP